MAKSRDAAKETYWRAVIRRQGASGLGVKRFCAREGVPEHRFYWWQRTLRQRDKHGVGGRSRLPGKQMLGQDAGGRGSKTPKKARPVRGGGTRRAGVRPGHPGGDDARHRGGQERHASAFLPVSLPLALGVPIEVVHPLGHVIRVPAIFDSAALKRVLAVLDSADSWKEA